MTKRLTEDEKKNRRPASRACVFCHSKHLQCSNERPCQNCIKRNRADDCQDIVRKRAKYLKNEEQPQAVSGDSTASPDVSVGPVKSEDVVNTLLFEPIEELPQSNASTHLHGINFNSNYLNQEYLMLGDILLQSKPTSPSALSASEAPGTHTVSPNNLLHTLTQKSTRPFISLENDSSKPATPQQPQQQVPDYVSPLISHHLYQTVQDIYANKIINFDYPLSYHSLTKFLKTRFSGNSLPEEDKAAKRKNLLIILKLIASYRPTFISAHKLLLKPYDLQFLEMSFQRSLIDYEHLSQLNLSPTIIWRRTGEIVSISNDLVSLLGFNLGDILSKRTFIMELMYDDELIINYFKLFKSVAVGNLHSSIKTKCKLIKNELSRKAEVLSTDYIEFCSVWTVKRDLFDLPMLIVGQFLPVLPAGEGVRMY